ncbi:MAG TPA: inositol 2-dehydrogenase [Thermoanaerobaculia bacterium]
MRRVPLAVLGAGRIGKMHVEALLTQVPEADVRAVCDPTIDVAWAESLGVRAVTDPAEVLNDRDIEAVVIAVPSTMHADLVIASARAGKQIFCEKPLTFDLSRAAEVRRVRDEAGVILQVGFNRRFDPDIRDLRDRVQAGAIGALEVIEIVNRDPAFPSLDFMRTSGGIFFDFAIHDFDVARFVSGREITSVYSRGAALVDPRISEFGDFDSATTVLQLEGDILAVIINSRQSRCGYDQRVEALGSLGSLAVDNRRTSAVIASTQNAVMHGKPLENFLLRYRGAYVEEFRGFCRSVIAGTPAEVGVDDVMAAIRAARAAKKSIAEERAVAITEVEGEAA